MNEKNLTTLKHNANNGIIFIFIIVIDQLSKYLSTNIDITIIPNILKFTYIQNTGAIFGIFEKNLVLIINIIVIIGIIIYWIKSQKSNVKNLSLVLIISGSIGNLIDRIFRGYVIDYIKLLPFGNLPIFNIADIFITIGFLIFIILIFKELFQKKENICK